MANENENLFELLKANEKRRLIINNLIENIKKEYGYVCFASRPLREGDYYETIDQKRSKTGYVSIIDIPVDLGIKETAVAILEAEYARLVSEFESYNITK